VRYPFSVRRALVVAAILLGTGVRVALLVEKPLWADEIFTLTLARKPAAAILDALRVDSGPPLHYLLSRLVLLPFGPAPGPHDVAVRVLSLVASLLHLPLLVLVARRLGRPEAGLPAAALYALFPIAAVYAAEGRAYVLASLLVLAAFERALALRETPTAGRSAALALFAGGAVLCHYLAVFPVAGFLALLPSASRPARLRLVLALAGAALLFLPWLPVALGQPEAAMAWSRGPEFAAAPLHFPVNLAWGMPPGRSLALLLPSALLLLGAALFFARRGPFRPIASTLVTGILLLVVAHLFFGPLLLPERPAVLFLPLVALLLAGAPRAVPLLSAAVSIAGLVGLLRTVAAPSTGERLAAVLTREMKPGLTVCAAALWGPELDYRLARAGLPGRVVLFPSDVARHPGWFQETESDAARLAAEARALVASPSPPGLYVLPKGSQTAAALRAELAPLGPHRIASSPFVEVLALP
jgi:4-amino-4-deoxy-L-arabinose transferase-like glycosyltransferase